MILDKSRIQKLMKRFDLNASQFAKEIGVGRQTVSGWLKQKEFTISKINYLKIENLEGLDGPYPLRYLKTLADLVRCAADDEHKNICVDTIYLMSSFLGKNRRLGVINNIMTETLREEDT